MRKGIEQDERWYFGSSDIPEKSGGLDVTGIGISSSPQSWLMLPSNLYVSLVPPRPVDQGGARSELALWEIAIWKAGQSLETCGCVSSVMHRLNLSCTDRALRDLSPFEHKKKWGNIGVCMYGHCVCVCVCKSGKNLTFKETWSGLQREEFSLGWCNILFFITGVFSSVLVSTH